MYDESCPADNINGRRQPLSNSRKCNSNQALQLSRIIYLDVDGIVNKNPLHLESISIPFGIFRIE